MDEKMGFGKYAELSFEQVRTQHPDYLEWARKQREEKGVYGRLERWVEYCGARDGTPPDAAASAEGASVCAVPYEAVPYFAVALVSREAAIQLEWGLSQRAAAWSSTPVPACMQGAPPPEGAETVLREHGARLGLDEATIAEYVRTGSADPAGTLAALCAALGIGFDPAMLHWPAGRRASDGVWAAHWYGAVEASTGFGTAETALPVLDAAAEAVADACAPHYAYLAAHRLRS